MKIELLGKRADVLAALTRQADAPNYLRTYLAAQIEALPETANGLSLTAISQTVRGLTNLHITIQPRAVA